MTSDLDIYRSANVLVKQHGQDAPIEAAMRADAMLEAGDLDGLAVWRRILRGGGGVEGGGTGAWGTGALSPVWRGISITQLIDHADHFRLTPGAVIPHTSNRLPRNTRQRKSKKNPKQRGANMAFSQNKR